MKTLNGLPDPLYTDRPLVCFQCKKPLDKNDPKSVHVAIDADACERYGIMDPSEIREEHRVIVYLCDVCGMRAQAPSVQQIRETYEDKPTVQ